MPRVETKCLGQAVEEIEEQREERVVFCLCRAFEKEREQEN